ncbi:hypothetical protein VCHENC02_3381A, partial [Vibrio harveyi]
MKINIRSQPAKLFSSSEWF